MVVIGYDGTRVIIIFLVDVEKEVVGGVKVNEVELEILRECFSCKCIVGMSTMLS